MRVSYARYTVDGAIPGVTVLAASAVLQTAGVELLCYVGEGFNLKYGGGSALAPNGDLKGLLLMDPLGQTIILDVDYSALLPGSLTILPPAAWVEAAPAFSLGDPIDSSLVFEDMAKKVYGDARLGVLLRQLNIQDLGQGARYIVPPLRELAREEVAPDSHIFKSIGSLAYLHWSKLWPTA